MKKKTQKRLGPAHYYGFEVLVKSKENPDKWILVKNFNSHRYRWYTDVLEKVELFPRKVTLLLGSDIAQEAIEFSYNRKRYMVVHYKL